MKAELQRELMEEQQIDELVQELNRLRDLAEDTENMNGEYACQSMDESLDESIMFCLQEMNTYERLELVKNALGVHALKELVQGFKETCEHYGIKENEDE